ncbi:MAG: hypothetical protein UY87_C0093G0002, partial [Candidatus Peribacteria bacterium GW2011_GWC2_54_8]
YPGLSRYILSSANSGAVSIAINKEFLIWSGDTFRPGGSVTVHDLDVNGTFDFQGYALTVNGSWDTTGGTASGSTTVTFTSTGSETITSDGHRFHAVTFTGSNALWTLQDASVINGTFTVLAGTLAQGNATLTVAGNVRIASGAAFTKSSNSSLLTLSGSLTLEDESSNNLGYLQFGPAPETMALSGALRVDKITVGTGDTLVLTGHNLSVGTGGLFIHGLLNAANNGADDSVITVSGSWLATGTGDFIAGTSTVLFDGTSGSYSVAASGAFFNFIVNGTGATYTATGSLDINRNILFSAGTFTAPPGNMTVSGSWTMGSSATFNHGSGTVVLDGGDQTLSGSTTFHNLTKTLSGSGRTLTFPATALQSVSGALTLTGLNENNKLTIRSSISGVQARLILDNTSSTQNVQYVDVQDNDASDGTAVVCNDCVDSGNNINWFFVTPTIVGTLYSDEGVTPLASKTVAISYNGGAVTDSITTDAGGQFSLSGAQMTGGTVLTLFVQGESEDAVTVVLGSGGTMTGIHLYQNRVIVRSESGSAAVTNTALAIARTTTSAADDIPNILVSASSAGITVAANKELLVWSGSTFRPGGTVSTHDLDINGTLTHGQNTLGVSGSWDTDAIYGSFSGTGATTFTSTGSETIRSSGDSFGAVTFSHSAGSWTLQDAMDINGAFTLSGGTLTQGNNTLNVSGNVRIAAGSTFVKSRLKTRQERMSVSCRWEPVRIPSRFPVRLPQTGWSLVRGMSS